MHEIAPLLATLGFPAIRRHRLETLQLNLGYRCNQSCLHCHVNAGPNRREEMTWQTIEQALSFAESADVHALDLTGGAPEMNANFRRLVQQARGTLSQLIDHDLVGNPITVRDYCFACTAGQGRAGQQLRGGGVK